jgi:glycosyltransferase involved in cell wall biosynthesis
MPQPSKLIVTIPAFNEEASIAHVIAEVPRYIVGIERVEVLVLDDGSKDRTVEVALAAGADHVVCHGRNRGLAAAFKSALQEAVARRADIIVNTDADNHYDQSRIPDLIQPVLRGDADIAVGSRVLGELPMPAANKYGNRLANFIMQRLLRLPEIDVSTGFRAYTREAALRLNVLSDHTYTHETLINALDQRLAIANVPLPARRVDRPSRLIRSIPSHVWKAGMVILKSFTLYRPLHVWGLVGLLFALAGAVPFVRFLLMAAQGDGAGHVQSLIAGAALWFLGIQMFIAGLLASAISSNRRLIEDVLYRMKQDQQGTAAPANRRTMASNGSNGNGAADHDHAGRQIHVA